MTNLQNRIQFFTRTVTDGVVEDRDIALVGHHVTLEDQGHVGVDSVKNNDIPLHGSDGEAVGANIGADILIKSHSTIQHG